MSMPLNIEEAYNRASYLCSRQEKCAFDIQLKLTTWGLEKKDCELVIKKLITERFIDHGRFTAAFVREKLNINKWGRKKIAYILRTKQIEQSIIDDCLVEFASDGYKETLIDLLTKKERTIKSKDNYDLKVKLLRFGFSRGFEASELETAIREVMKRVADNKDFE